MPRTAIAVQEVAFQGNAAISFAAFDQPNGMKFPADGRTVLIINNAAGVPRNVTLISVPESRYGRSAPSAQTAIAIAAGAIRLIGPLPPEVWNQQSGADQGFAQVDIDVGTSVTVAAVRLNQS